MKDNPTDAMGPWAVKSIPTSTVETIKLAAHDEHLTVGQWLERRVNEWVSSGKPVPVQLDRVQNQVLPELTPTELFAFSAEQTRLALALEGKADTRDTLIKSARANVRIALLALRAPAAKETMRGSTELETRSNPPNRAALPAPRAK